MGYGSFKADHTYNWTRSVLKQTLLPVLLESWKGCVTDLSGL